MHMEEFFSVHLDEWHLFKVLKILLVKFFF
jgi:hypothetical protein